MVTPEPDPFRIRQELLDIRREIVENRGLRQDVCIERAADSMDRCQAAEARELAVRTLDRSSRRIRQIEDALHRLANGVYGICVDCEEEVAPGRLRALPWTPLCLKCQEIADRNEFRGCNRDSADFLNAP